MKYHMGSRFGLPESLQSMIYWTCQSYEHLNTDTRQLIDQAARAGGERDAKVVLEALTTADPIPEIALRYCCSSTPIDPSLLTKKVRVSFLTLACTLPSIKKDATRPPPTP